MVLLSINFYCVISAIWSRVILKNMHLNSVKFVLKKCWSVIHLSIHWTQGYCNSKWLQAGIILCMWPTNKGWCYTVMLSLIGRAHTQNDPLVKMSQNVVVHQGSFCACTQPMRYSSILACCLWLAGCLKMIPGTWGVNTDNSAWYETLCAHIIPWFW